MRIKNWEKFQHFRDRKPPWIKLYRDILDDPDWHELSGDEAKTLTMLWLIASETNGYLPDIKRISFRLRITETRCNAIISKLLHWIDIKAISTRYQVDAPEGEGETERETEKETETENAGTVADADVDTEQASAKLHELLKWDGKEIQGDTDEMWALWRRAYPGVNLEVEAEKAQEWLRANPTKMKRNLYRFISNWFRRCQG